MSQDAALGETPHYSDRRVLAAIAGSLRACSPSSAEYQQALAELSHWRSIHSYPMNTFQALLRLRAREKLRGEAEVVTRLKRAPSIVAKLDRIPSLRLHQMQDIAGLRAVTTHAAGVDQLFRLYKESRFEHELVGVDDYITEPKDDGYRSIHLKYRYRHRNRPRYDGLRVEVQLRTKLQHSWATAVELQDMFSATSAIKAGGGDAASKDYFRLASAAFAMLERQQVGAAFQGRTREQLFEELASEEARLQVVERLRGYALAAREIQQSGWSRGGHYVIALNLLTRQLTIASYPPSGFESATARYAELESQAAQGEPIDPVLVNAASLQSLEKMFPNYFMDADVFNANVRHIIALSRAKPIARPGRKAKPPANR